MTARRTLPNRRRHELITFEHDGQRYHASVSRFADGSLAEIFLNARPGSAIDVAAHDLAVVASLSLQFGVPVAAIRKAVLKLPCGESAGPLGRLLDLLDAQAYAP